MRHIICLILCQQISKMNVIHKDNFKLKEKPTSPPSNSFLRRDPLIRNYPTLKACIPEQSHLLAVIARTKIKQAMVLAQEQVSATTLWIAWTSSCTAPFYLSCEQDVTCCHKGFLGTFCLLGLARQG